MKAIALRRPRRPRWDEAMKRDAKRNGAEAIEMTRNDEISGFVFTPIQRRNAAKTKPWASFRFAWLRFVSPDCAFSPCGRRRPTKSAG
jgi:hypothetical protein